MSHDIGDALEADARQRRDGLGRKPQCRERQRRKRRTFFALGDACFLRKVWLKRATAKAAPIVRRDGGARREAETVHARDEIVAQLLLAAEQMRAAADVEQDAVRRIGGDQRRVALAPVGDGVEQMRVGVGVLRHRGEIGMHGARLRQRHAGRRPSRSPPHRPRRAASALPRLP